jgi:hypothetical protein
VNFALFPCGKRREVGFHPHVGGLPKGKIGCIALKKLCFRKIPLKDLEHMKYHRKILPSPKTSILSRFRDNTVNPPSSPSSSHLLISPSSHRLRTSGQALLRQLRLRWSPCTLRGQMMRMGRRVTGDERLARPRQGRHRTDG